MSERTRGLVLIVVGVLLALIGLAADVLGLGGHPGIGWKQILGMLIGVGVVVIGLRAVRH